MASSLERLATHSRNSFRSAFSRTFSADALVEKDIKPGLVSGIPQEHRRRRKVVIYSPAPIASQQGSGKVGTWKINFISTNKWENPLMGWTSIGDPYSHVGDSALGFDSEEAAKDFAERHGWDFEIKKRQTPLLKITKLPSKSLARILFSSRALCTATETRTQKLERIADDLLSLNKLEKHDYAILFRHKMGLHRYGPAISGLGSSSGPSGSGPGAAADAKPAEKLVFDVKLEKFDSAGKIKVIKEIRGFTELGLKEAKDLVEKAPVVVKKGVTKEEAEAIMEKLKAVGATVVME